MSIGAVNASRGMPFSTTFLDIADFPLCAMQASYMDICSKVMGIETRGRSAKWMMTMMSSERWSVYLMFLVSVSVKRVRILSRCPSCSREPGSNPGQRNCIL